MDKDKLSKEVLDAVRPPKKNKKQALDGDAPREEKRKPPPHTPKLEQEKLPERTRNAFQFVRYHNGPSASKLGVNQSLIYKIENGGSVSAETVLGIIKKAWGFDSFKELIEKADTLKEELESKKTSIEPGKWTGMVNDRSVKQGNKLGK